jgi:uncharacterized glyoxalase superfamily protein PhnB
MPDTSTLHCLQAIPSASYADAHAAIAWLTHALGADARTVHTDPSGRTVVHAELWFGQACVMIGTLRDDGRPPTHPGQALIYLVVDAPGAVDALHARAQAAGARVTMPPHDTDYGSHDFSCLDPEGNLWAFGTYAPARHAAAVG